MNKFYLVSILFCLMSCAASKSGNEINMNDSIGSAKMDEEGIIYLQLRAETSDESNQPAVGDALIIYHPEDPKYLSILDHLGGLKPGEEKLVKPWELD